MFHNKQNAKHRNEKDENVVVVHLSARSIVFRNHVRRADKTVRQVLEEVSLVGDDLSSSFDKDDDDDDSSIESYDSDQNEDSIHENSLLRMSVRGSMRGISKQESVRHLQDFTKTMDQELKTLATSMVPDLKQKDHLTERHVEIEGFQVTQVKPFPSLELTGESEFKPLLDSDSPNDDSWTVAEKEVFQMLKDQKACVKTIKNTGTEWSDFLKRFTTPHANRGGTRFPSQHDDIGPHNDFAFNSFLTSTSLLPELGKKMRCYGSLSAYGTGVVFALPTCSSDEAETKEQERTKTWAWPAGYAAKTEFNIERGKLINGRQEALVSLTKLRDYNHEYLHSSDHFIGTKVIKGGMQIVPYNEVYLRVGGKSRIVDRKDVATGQERSDANGTGRSFEGGCGLPVALFARDNKMSDLISLLRVRSRIVHVLGEEHFGDIPLLLISHDVGVRVFTKSLQHQFWKLAAHKLNPFQNPMLAPSTRFDNTREASLQQKLQELLELKQDLRQALSSKECSRIAGGFGVSDGSIFDVLKAAVAHDKSNGRLFKKSHKLQDALTEGFAYAARSDDYYTARQLLIVYVIISGEESLNSVIGTPLKILGAGAASYTDVSLLNSGGTATAPTLPPPLDTTRVRSATQSQGLLVVFGAAQMLASLKNSSARRRAEESYRAVEEWIEKGKKSMAYRVSSWQTQRDAQDDANLAAENDSLFLAFVSQKAIKNRKKFAQQLRNAVNDYTDASFVRAVYEILNSMKHPSLRLELLQYILGLDNRYSITCTKQTVELAATCMSLAK